LLTISQFSSVKEVKFLTGGEEARTYLPRRLDKDSMLFFVPYRVGERYYLLPREAVKLRDEINTPDALVNTVLDEFRAFYPELPQVKRVYLKSEAIILDWDISIKDMFFAGAGPEHKELVSLLVDSLLLTLASNLEPNCLLFFVDGLPWTLPEEYAFLNLTLEHPFYINPE
jgi:hypothetical protein